MNNDIKTVLIDEYSLANRVNELGEQIVRDYKDSTPILINILRGGVVFLADLIRVINIPIDIDFMSISSYGNDIVSSGEIKIRKNIDSDIFNRDVIIVEDIVDSGITLSYLVKYLEKYNPKSVSICTLLNKPTAHKVNIDIKYAGFEIGEEFVVGYGLDYAEKYRNLPYIGILKEEIYK